MEKNRYDDRMLIDVTGITKTPCSVKVHGVGRLLYSKLVYGEQTSARIVIFCQQRPFGTTAGLNERVAVPDGTELTITDNAGHEYDSIRFRPGYTAELAARKAS